MVRKYLLPFDLKMVYEYQNKENNIQQGQKHTSKRILITSFDTQELRTKCNLVLG